MPRTTKAKTTSPKKPTRRVAKKDESALLEFEDFISQKPQASRSKGWLAVTLIFLIAILAVAWFFMSQTINLQKEVKFKAVYLDNNQVYYAKVVKEDSLNIYLDEVYYIQSEDFTIPAEEEDGEPQIVTRPVLVQRGQELHKPEGLMQINRDKLVAIEEIGAESEILAEIERISQ